MKGIDMKRVVFALVMVVFGMEVLGQTPHVPPLDTIRGREIIYYYSPHFWHNKECGQPFRYQGLLSGPFEPITAFAEYYYSDTTLNIIGLAAAARRITDWSAYDEEYPNDMKLSLIDAISGQMVKVASGTINLNRADRWMEFDSPHDHGNYWQRHVIPIQEVYFDKPVMVRDSFYVACEGEQNFQGYCLGEIGAWSYWGTIPGCVLEGRVAFYYANTSSWGFRWDTDEWFLFPIIDSTGWYLKCDTLVCPVAEEVELSIGAGMAVLRWSADTLLQSRWQVSYGPEGTAPGAGRVLNCNHPNTVLYNLEDTVRYVAYVRGYCEECHKWSAWSDGVAVYMGEEEGMEAAEAVAVELEPNPARGRATVRAGEVLRCVTVRDMRGAEVERVRCTGRTAELDVSGWPAGVYYVTVDTQSGTAQRKLVVQ